MPQTIGADMTKLEQYREILTQLENGDSKKLNAVIAVTLLPDEYEAGGENSTVGGYVYATRGGMRFCGTVSAPPYTTSVTAALKIIERKLTDWPWYVGKEHRIYQAAITYPGSREDLDYGAHGPTPAIALLRALFRVLIAQEKLNL